MLVSRCRQVKHKLSRKAAIVLVAQGENSSFDDDNVVADVFISILSYLSYQEYSYSRLRAVHLNPLSHFMCRVTVTMFIFSEY